MDISQPRWRYWISRAEDEMRCPRCNALLTEEHHPYLVLVKEGAEVSPYICGSDAGYLCGNCPTIVLDRGRFEETIGFVVTGSHSKYSVPGIVDLDGVSEEKGDLELGSNDNPIPLVRFREPPRFGRASSKSGRRKKASREKHR